MFIKNVYTRNHIRLFYGDLGGSHAGFQIYPDEFVPGPKFQAVWSAGSLWFECIFRFYSLLYCLHVLHCVLFVRLAFYDN